MNVEYFLTVKEGVKHPGAQEFSLDVWAFSSQWSTHNTAVEDGGGPHVFVV